VALRSVDEVPGVDGAQVAFELVEDGHQVEVSFTLRGFSLSVNRERLR
jgi:hypothetical protein